MKNKIILGVVAILASVGIIYAANELNVSISSSYNKGGVVVQLVKSMQSTCNNTNVNLVPFNTGTADTAVTITPITSNAYITVINTSATNTANYIKIGNASNSYSFFLNPQEVFAGRLLPGGDGYLHVAASNGTQSGVAMIPPTP